MIKVVASTSRLVEWLKGWDPAFGDSLENAFNKASGDSSRVFATIEELETSSVYEIFQDLHNRAVNYIRDAIPGFFSKIVVEFRRTAKDSYYREDFDSDEACAINFLAFHIQKPHGWLEMGAWRLGVFLPDYAMKKTVLGFILDGQAKAVGSFDYVHMSDTLRSVVDRLLLEIGSTTSNDITLVLQGRPSGFPAYQTLRRSNPTSHASVIASNANLVEAAVRFGLGENHITGVFPSRLWGGLTPPVKEILAQAAENVAAVACRPLSVNLLHRKNINSLLTREQLRSDEKTEYLFKIVTHLIESLSTSLKRDESSYGDTPNRDQSSLEERVDRDKADLEDMVKVLSRDSIDDLTHGIISEAEVELSSKFTNDVEEESRPFPSDDWRLQRSILALQPLHKRVLGLIEYVVVRRLRKLGSRGNGAAAIWEGGFTRGPLRNCFPEGDMPYLGFVAKLEVEGSWLNHASRLSNPEQSSNLRLTDLLDGIFAGLVNVPLAGGIELTLNPDSAASHAKQLAIVGDVGSKGSAFVTMWLGKVAVSLRNFMEHGQDEVTDDFELLVDGSEYWSVDWKLPGELRDTNNIEYLKVLDWLKKAASHGKVSWRCELPASIPKPANNFLLDRESLRRCLVLISLALHGADRHLGLNIEDPFVRTRAGIESIHLDGHQAHRSLDSGNGSLPRRKSRRRRRGRGGR